MDPVRLFDSLPPGAQVWFSILFLLGLFVVMFSRRLAESSGPLGRLLGAVARAFNERQLREVNRQRSITDVMNKAFDERAAPLKAEIKRLAEELVAVREELATEREERRVERMATERTHMEKIMELQARIDVRDEWILYATREHQRDEIFAAQTGVVLPSEWVSFNDWPLD